MNDTSPIPQWPALAVRCYLVWAAVLALLFGATATLQAQYTFTNGFNPNGGSGANNWNTAVNWSPNGYPNGVDAVAIFNALTNAGVAVNPNLTLNGGFTVGSLYSTNSSGWLFKYGTGVGTLTLQTTLTPQPLFYMGSSSSECWFQSAYIAGNQGFVFNSATGSQKLTFRYNNNFMTNFSGPIVVGNGTLGINGAYNLGYASSITLSNGTEFTQENANSVASPSATFAGMPIILAGSTATLYNNAVGTLIIQGPVESPGTNTTLTYNAGSAACGIILAGTNSYSGNTTVSGGILISSTGNTGVGSHTVAASVTDGAMVSAGGTSLTLSNLTLTATTAANGSSLAFCPGTAGLPTVPLINVTNLLVLGNTNFTTPIKLFGGGWQVGSSIPLLHFGNVTNVYTNGLFNGFQLATLPSGITGALVNGTATNQINLNITGITPLVWAPTSANANWASNGNWTLNGTATNYTEPYSCFGPAVVFDDSLTPAGPSIIVTNNGMYSPNSIVFNNTNKNYTLLNAAGPTGQGGGVQNNTSVTMNGPGYVTNSLYSIYLGGTFLNAGTMVLNNGYALPYNAGKISFGGGTLQYSANSAIGGVQVDYSSRFSSAANQAFSLNTGGQNITLATGLASSGGSLTHEGAGTLILAGASTYTGATTNAAGTLKLKIANALPTSTALMLGSSATAATFDLAGCNQQLAGLAEASGATAAIITNSSSTTGALLSYNGGTSTFGGSIVDGVISTTNVSKPLALTVGSGSLTLTGANTYSGNTTISNGATLLIGSGGSIASSNIVVGSGSTFDVSGVTFATLNGGSVDGIGAVNGNLEVASGAGVKPGIYGAVTGHGTLTFSNNLTLDQGAACTINVDTNVSSANNDSLLVSGSLAANDTGGNTINITAGTAALATGTDYTLITATGGITGYGFNTIPNWVGATRPVNYAHYTVVTGANTVTLHYSTGVLLSGAGAVSPTMGLHQNYLFTVLVTPGTGSTGIGVTADFTSLGGSIQTFTGVTNLYSYTYAVPGTLAPGYYTVPFTVTDAESDTYTGNIYVTIANGSLVWDGAGADSNWSSLNWLNGATPDTSGDAGDTLVFAGSTRLSPVMNNNYNVGGVIFSNTAGAFNISSSGNTLTLAAGGTVESDASATEALDVPINLTSGSQFNITAGNLIVGALGGSSDGFTKSGTGTLTIDGTAATSSFAGTVALTGGTLALSNASDVLPTAAIVAYSAPAKLDLGGQSQSIANLSLSSLTTGTATLTNGDLTVTDTSLNFSPNTAATAATTVDLSGLSNLAYGAGTVYFYGELGANSTLKLAQTNNITATQIYLANGGLSSVTATYTATMLLGESNSFNISTLQLGGYHNAAGTIAFNAGLSNPTLTLRGQAGTGSAVGTITIGANNNGSNPSFAIDTRAGSIDAIVNQLYVLNNNSGGGSWTDSLSMSNGTFNAGHIFMNYDYGTTVTGSSALINQNGGTMLVGTLGLNANTSTGVPTTTSIYNLGKDTNASPLLSANILTIGATAAPSTNSRATINFTNGTIENYDPTLGQSDSVGVAAGGSSVQQNLDISGLTGGGATNNYQTLNIVLSPVGTHNFNAESGYTITEESTAVISGSGGLTANGPGLVTLYGTNTYTGNTTVSAGTLEIAQPSINTLSTVMVSTGAVLQLDFAVTNQVAALVINGVSKSPGVYSSATDPLYITGTGSLLVVPISTNAFLTSLALTPNDSFTPGFTTNGFAYYATNSYGSNLTVTVANSSSFASSQLYLNGRSMQALTSSVPSMTLTNFGVGSTNVIAVLVTAQDGVTTNLYAVNLTELPAIIVNTNTFAISNFVAGGSLNLSWPSDHLGWRLQVQTNTLSTGLGTNWSTWTGSTTVTNVSIPINPANPSVFLRMVYP